MKLTKIEIEKLANEIVKWLKDNDMLSATCIYYNNKRICDGVLEDGEFDPHDYFEYAAYDHILSMSFEDNLYDLINYMDGNLLDKFNDIFKKYGLYYELGNSWNLTCHPEDDDMEVEYTVYEKESEPIYIYDINQHVPSDINKVIIVWKSLQDIVGNVGSCVLGAGFKFKYEGQKYFMTPCSRYQGSISWETHRDIIERLLMDIGATDIYYNWGRMD